MKVDILGWVRDALEENGINIKAIEGDNTCVRFELDFSEHDKYFEDKISDLEQRIRELIKEKDEYKRKRDSFGFENLGLKQRISEFESLERSELPFDPLECAKYLINATYQRETSAIEQSFYNRPKIADEIKYTIDDLEQIAEHLLIHCKHSAKEVNHD